MFYSCVVYRTHKWSNQTNEPEDSALVANPTKRSESRKIEAEGGGESEDFG